jgi:hypothetical protein
VTLQTLDQFINTHQQKPQGRHSNAYVRVAGFSALYVRMGPRYLCGTVHPCVLDIANVTARRPGNGAFTCLAEDLRRRGLTLYVESVLNERFAKMLPRLGFTQVPGCVGSPSFFLLSQESV